MASLGSVLQLLDNHIGYLDRHEYKAIEEYYNMLREEYHKNGEDYDPQIVREAAHAIYELEGGFVETVLKWQYEQDLEKLWNWQELANVNQRELPADRQLVYEQFLDLIRSLVPALRLDGETKQIIDQQLLIIDQEIERGEINTEITHPALVKLWDVMGEKISYRIDGAYDKAKAVIHAWAMTKIRWDKMHPAADTTEPLK